MLTTLKLKVDAQSLLDLKSHCKLYFPFTGLEALETPRLCPQYIAKKVYKETETLPLVETHVVEIISITDMQIVNLYRQQKTWEAGGSECF